MLRMSLWFTLMLLLVVTRMVSSGHAQGYVATVEAEQTPVLPGVPVTVVVGASGFCAQAVLNFGDTTSAVITPGGGTQHTYAQPGTYLLTANGQGDCRGFATEELPVIDPITLLYCYLYGCNPVIRSTFPPADDPSTPGHAVFINGTGFGTQTGRMFIHIMDFQGDAEDIPMQVLYWSSTYVVGLIPEWIFEVQDQEAPIRVVTSGQSSNVVFINFRATRDMELLPWQAVGCKPSVTSDSSNTCNDPSGGAGTFPSECFQFGIAGGGENGGTINGEHSPGWGGGALGFDKFSRSLANGWIVDHRDALWYEFDNGAANEWAEISPDLTPGSSDFNLQVWWQANACGILLYEDNVYITGPSGLTW